MSDNTKGFRGAVFIDRDGTVSEEVGYVNHISRFRLLPTVPEAILELNKHNIPAVVTTNQAGVARGYFKENLINVIHSKMISILAEHGAKLLDVYYCPHHPTAGEPPYRQDCDCRKPKTGLLMRASREHNIDLSSSYVIGDKWTDVEFGHRAGANSILVLTGYGIGEWEDKEKHLDRQPEFVAQNLLDAVKWIISRVEGQ